MTAATAPMTVNRIVCNFICLPFSLCSCERLLFFVSLDFPCPLVHLSGAFLSTGRLEGGFPLLPGGPPGNHLFIAQRVGNEGGHLKGTNTWPAKGLSWYGVSRRLRSDVTRGAPFSGGKGDQGDTLKGCFLVVIEAPEKAEGGIAGLCADEHRLYVSCPGANEIGGIPGCTSSRPAPGCGACRATGSCSSMTCIQRRSRPIASIRPGPEESPCPRSSSPRATSRSRTRPGRPANPTKENGFGGTAMGTAPLIRPSI